MKIFYQKPNLFFCFATVFTMLASSPIILFAQKSKAGNPYTWDASSQSRTGSVTSFKTGKFSFPEVIDNVQKAQEAGRSVQATGGARPYGTVAKVSVNLKTAGVPTKTPAGNVWLLEVGSGTALGLQFSFDKFYLPPGASLFIYNKNRSAKLGAFTNENNHPSKTFATQPIKGDTVILEYFEPGNSLFEGQLNISRIVHVFNPVAEILGVPGFGQSASCEINVNCYGTMYAQESKAICAIGYLNDDNTTAFAGSGAMINSTSHKNYLLTASHVLPYWGAGYYNADLIFYYNYASPDCNNPDTAPITSTLQGATVRSHGEVSDYFLLELTDNPKTFYNTNYLGWDSRDYDPMDGVFDIHQPNGDIQKIATSFSVPLIEAVTPGNYNITGDPNGTPKTDLTVTWGTGLTEGGSSGSPLIDMDTRMIIGQLRAGTSSCTLDGPDYFGRFAISFTTPDDGFPTLASLLTDGSGMTSYLGDYNGNPANPQVTIASITLSTSAFQLPNNTLTPVITTSGNTGTLSYAWSPSSDFSYPNLQQGVITFQNNFPSLPLTKVYTLTVTPQYGAAVSKSITVSLYDCVNKAFTINSHINTNTPLGRDDLGPGETYSWTPVTYLTGTTISDPIFKVQAAGIYNYSMTAKNSYCSRTETTQIYVPSPPVPQTFFPGIVEQKEIGIAGQTVGPADNNAMIKWQSGFLLLAYHTPANTYDRIQNLYYLDGNLSVIWQRDIRPTVGWVYPVATNDGGFLLAGNAQTADDTQSVPFMNKFDASGNEQWYVTYPNAPQDDYYGYLASTLAVAQTSDGNYVITSKDDTYGYVTKISQTGTVLWTKSISFSKNSTYETMNNIKPTADGGFITSGTLIIKFDAAGNKQWDRIVDSNDADNAPVPVVLTGDGYVMAEYMEGLGYVQIVKYDLLGNTVWASRYAGSGPSQYPAPIQYIQSLIHTMDGNFLLAGSSNMNAGGDKSENSRGDSDYWILKLDANGNKLGDKTFGGGPANNPVWNNLDTQEAAFQILEVSLDKYLLVGTSDAPATADKTVAMIGLLDIWLLEIGEGTPAGLPSMAVTASGPLAFCQGSSVTLTSATDSRVIWLWEQENLTTSTWSTISSKQTVSSLTITTAGTYRLTASLLLENQIIHGPVFVIAPTSVPVPTITSSGTICPSGTITLTASSANGYQWSTGEASRSITTTSPGNYQVTDTYSTGCANISSVFVIGACPPPVVPCNSIANGKTPCGGGGTPVGAAEIPDGVFPNPANGTVNIKLATLANSDLIVKMYTTMGVTMRDGVIKTGEDGAQIPTSDLADNLYLLRIEDKLGNRTVWKIMIKH